MNIKGSRAGFGIHRKDSLIDHGRMLAGGATVDEVVRVIYLYFYEERVMTVKSISILV